MVILKLQVVVEYSDGFNDGDTWIKINLKNRHHGPLVEVEASLPQTQSIQVSVCYAAMRVVNQELHSWHSYVWGALLIKHTLDNMLSEGPFTCQVRKYCQGELFAVVSCYRCPDRSAHKMTNVLWYPKVSQWTRKRRRIVWRMLMRRKTIAFKLQILPLLSLYLWWEPVQFHTSVFLVLKTEVSFYSVRFAYNCTPEESCR